MISTEAEFRLRLVEAARSWLGTPYVSNGLVKGSRGGTDCAMLLLGIYQEVGLVPKEFDPRPYPTQWHLHQTEEVYMRHVLGWAHEVVGPPERIPQPGDVVMFKIGRVFAHGAIVIAWPNIIHALGNARVVLEDVSRNTTGKRALWLMPKHFFSYWG